MGVVWVIIPASTQMDHWDEPLAYVITPKSGPLRKMVSLLDANRALIGELPKGYLKRAHWLRAGQALVTAAETGGSKDIEWAFEAIVAALDEEGWLPQGASRVPPPRSGPPRSEPPRFEPLRLEPLCFELLRRVRPSIGYITPRRPPEPLWRRIQPRSAARPWVFGEKDQISAERDLPENLFASD